MRVLLVDLDSRIPNLALMKLSSYYKGQGHDVGLKIANPDLIIISAIFQKNRRKAQELKEFWSVDREVEVGGPGMYPDIGGLKKIDLLKPDYDLYPSVYSQGYTTRGCIRRCPFCLVPQMEGGLRIVQHPSEFHDDRFETMMLLDNNLLAASKEWVREVLGWFYDAGVMLNMTQGFDARLLTEEYTGWLKEIFDRKAGLHFAWDNIGDEAKIKSAVTLLKNAGINTRHDVSFYVLGGYNTTFEQDLYRVNKLREWGTHAFVMEYHKNDRRLNALARWANRRNIFWEVPFEQYTRKTAQRGAVS